MPKQILLVFFIALHFSLIGNNAAQKRKVEQEARELGRSQGKKLSELIKHFDADEFVLKTERKGEGNPETLRQQSMQLLKEGSYESEFSSRTKAVSLLQSLNPQQVSTEEFERNLEGLIPEDSTQDSKVFPKIMSKLSLFNEIKKDLEDSGASDATRASLFSGECRKCSKSVLGKVLYDCCIAMKGGATKARLAKCSAEEIAFSRMREEGRCHYVGTYKNRVLGAKREAKQVFCCFPSKLARIFQEQGRVQLHKGWGTAKNPNCNGLAMQEINKLDFTKIDLQEMVSDHSKSGPQLQSKLKSFQNRLREAQMGGNDDL